MRDALGASALWRAMSSAPRPKALPPRHPAPFDRDQREARWWLMVAVLLLLLTFLSRLM